MTPNKINALLLSCGTRCLLAMADLAKGVVPKAHVAGSLEVAREMLDKVIEELKK